MKCLTICDPTRYAKPPLDVSSFYQQMSCDSRVSFYHIPTKNVFKASQQLPTVHVASSQGQLSYNDFIKLGDRAGELQQLSDIDLVFCRTPKPFAPDYLQYLAKWEEWTQFVNRPSSKLEQLQPDFLFKVAKGFIPDALVTSDWQTAQDFFERHQIIVAKQDNSCGGRGVYKIWYQRQEFQVDNVLLGTQTFPSFAAVMKHLQQGTSAQKPSKSIQFYRYLNRVDAGDKRVVVVDGEIYGSYLRRSKSGHWVNNVSADGECTLANISSEEIEAIQQTVGHYQRLGLHTLGYDFLMDDDGTWRISEINAGNIGGFARLELLTGKPVMDRFITWMIEFAQRPATMSSNNVLIDQR